VDREEYLSLRGSR